jgi:hypothetical protein
MKQGYIILRRQHRKKGRGKLVHWRTRLLIIIVLGAIIGIYFVAVKYLVLGSSEKSNSEISRKSVDLAATVSNVISTSATRGIVDGSLSSQKNRSLPDLRKGGIVLFYHMPKTGGTALRYLAKKNEQIEFHSNQKVSMEEIKQQINQWTMSKDIVVGEGQKVKFVELHYALEPFVASNDDLVKWRADAKENNIPFFVFTVLREPVEAFISFFNYFCILLGKAGHVQCPLPHDFNKMIEISPDNPQARWLCFATTLSLNEKNNDQLESFDSCASRLPDMMDSNFDWIGIKSRLKDTSAVFDTMGIALGWAYKNNIKKLAGFQKKKNFSTKEMETVENLLNEDSKMYRRADSFYTLQNFGIDTKVLDET